jgi:ribosome-binding ATPase YchF (GTP1/OBG family)
MRSFEPANISMSMEAQIDPNDDPKIVIAEVKRRVKEEVETEVKRLKKERILTQGDPEEKYE